MKDTCRCGRKLVVNLKTGKLFTYCATCRREQKAKPGRMSPTLRLHRPDVDVRERG